MKKTTLAFALFLTSLGMQAKPIYVKTTGTDSDGNGISWSSPFKSIGYALQKAAAGDEIYVASGTYTQTWGNLKAKVSLYGGFEGTEASPSQRALKAGGKPYEFANKTIITVANDVVFSTTASFTDANTLSIDGFAFEGSIHDKTIFTARGGVAIRNCRFVNNTLNVTSPTVAGTQNLIFLYLTAASPSTASSISDCLIEGNINHQNQNILGVSTTGETTTAAIERVEITGNTTDLAAGSTNANIVLTGGSGLVSIRNCRLYNNSSKQAALSTAIGTEVINTLIYNNTCGTNHVLLMGQMCNSMVTNNTGRFCFNHNDSKLYNSVVIGNVAGLAQNTGITAQTIKHCAVTKLPVTGVFADNIILETAEEVKFSRPTSFKGVATTDAQKAEFATCNWNVLSASPLINKGNSAWFKESQYGKIEANNKDYTETHVRHYGTKCDMHALESDKYKLTIAVGSNGSIPDLLDEYYAPGETIEMNATPERGYKIEKWTNEAGETISTNAQFAYTMPATKVQLTVSFVVTTKSYKLTLAATQGGTATIEGEPHEAYFQDEQIALKATPALGYRFEKWTDELGTNLSTDPLFTYTMPARAATVTANFVLKANDAPDAHAFDFEGLTVNEQWKTADGTLSLTEDRSQTGTQSLRWTTTAKASNLLKIELKTVYTIDPGGAGSNTCYFNFYNKEPLRDGTIQVRFLDANGIELCAATLTLDFIGWREFERVYGYELNKKPSGFKKVASIEFVLNNPEAKAVSVDFDQVNLETVVSKNRILGDWNAPDAKLFPSQRLLNDYASIFDPTLPFSTPTADELQGLATVKARYAVAPRKGDLESAVAFVKALNLTRNSDGTVRGTVVPLREYPIGSIEQAQEICTRLEALGFGAKESNEVKTLLNDYLDYILDQGLLYRVTQISSSNYAQVRSIGTSLTSALAACQTERQNREFARFVYWIMSYGHIHRADYLTSQNSDLIYNYIEYYTATSANIMDPTVAVRELKGMKRYLDRATEITPGGSDLLKPDGTGFHHATHYQHYMYAYIGWIKVWGNLMGTSFRPEPEAYEVFKKAAKTMLIFTTRGDKGNFSANSVGGRNPFKGGNRSQLNRADMETLSKVGGDVLQTATDEDLDQFIAYMFDPKSASTLYDGYHAFNWSPAGVYRHANWVATMRAPTTKFWGCEIYDKRNRFGRYQSHGTLEVLYNDQSTPSGYPSDNNIGGWDWNTVPGGTTVHFTDWTEMMPGRSLDKRFDQFAVTKNFAGALPFAGCGLFASDFDQGNDWGGQMFAPTGLSFKKSVFAIDGKLISLGSNISSTATPANTGTTATNLFQSFKPSVGPNINGTVLTDQSTTYKDYASGVWMLTPEGTGYYVPKGNKGLKVYYGSQTGPLDDGSDVKKPKSSVAAKVYIDHGTKPTNQSYHFVVIPAADANTMSAAAQQIGDAGGELYTINNQDETLHSLTYKASKITAYAFFEAKEGLTFGNIAKVGSEMLLMEKTVSEKRLSYGVCNPNLRPVTGKDTWEASPTNTSITVKGVWYPASAANENVIISNDGSNTTVTLVLKDGLPLYFELDKSPSNIPDAPTTPTALVWVDGQTLHVAADQESSVALFLSSGAQHSTASPAFNHSIALSKGIYTVRVANEKEVTVYKVAIP